MKISTEHKKFIHKSSDKAKDNLHYSKLDFNIGKYNQQIKQGLQSIQDLDRARDILFAKKKYAIHHLDQMLLLFEEQFELRGGKVIWAKDEKEAIAYILEICEEKKTKLVVKSKSMVTEEIHLNHHLKEVGIESIETDLGEFIQQIDNQAPYHIVTPAMHKSKEDVSLLFHKKFNTPLHSTPTEIAAFTRNHLRSKYKSAQVGITGANFIIADTGCIAITENEGNARLTTSLPSTHIVVVGIEKIIPQLEDLHYFWPMLSTFGTGQKLTSYNTIIGGPMRKGEHQGPEDMYVILLDNGRSRLLQDKDLIQSLYCIRCGACLNVCPVYKHIGGHAYGTTYSGPIGAVISPHLNFFDEFHHLSFASSLCGACTEVCPVKIPIHRLIHKNRTLAVESKLTLKSERRQWKWFTFFMSRRKSSHLIPASLKTYLAGFFLKKWNQFRAPIIFQDAKKD